MKHTSDMGEYRKYRKQTGIGKGDKRRPTDDKKFRENFDAINWGNKERPKASDDSIPASDTFYKFLNLGVSDPDWRKNIRK